MIKINPSKTDSAQPELNSSETRWKDFSAFFAVGVKRPHYQHLIFYGQDGPDYYVWLAFGKMTGLHEGLTAAIDAMYENEDLHVYGCNGFKEAIAFAENHEKHASEHETISLYYCALAVAENDHGSDSIEYGLGCFYLARFYKNQENFEAAYDFLKKSSAIAKRLNNPEHPWAKSCKTGLADLESILAN